MGIILLVSCLLSFSLFIETFGFLLRAVGKENNSISFGYSAHVQLATISRIGTFIGLPIIAYLIDRNIESTKILILPIFTFFLYSIFSFITLKSQKLSISISYFFFNKIIELSRVSIEKKELTLNKDKFVEYKLKNKNLNQIKKFGVISFFFTSGAFFISSIFAQHYQFYSDAILQFTPFISFLGSMSSFIFFDSNISHLIDSSDNPFLIIFEVIKIRLIASILLLISFLLTFIIIMK